MILDQDGTIRDRQFVSVEAPVRHEINITDTDMAVINNSSYIEVFWFIDCKYVGKTSDLSYVYNYTSEGQSYNMEALVVASPDPVKFLIRCLHKNLKCS